MPLRILLIDDNPDVLRAYAKALLRDVSTRRWNRGLFENDEGRGIDVLTADTSTIGLQKLRDERCDLLVIDLKIPGPAGEEMGGLEIISESIALDALRPIIAITGYGSVELARKTLIQGVFDFIEKSPTAIADLINSVQKAIDSQDDKMLRSGNPFTPMTGVEPTIFGGRSKELEFFEQKLNRTLSTKFSEHFLVLGNWGIGKSTLLSEYKKICQSRGHMASIVPLEPLQQGTSLIEAARSIVEGILRDLPYPIEQFKKVVSFFDSLGISVLGTGLQLKRDTTRKEISTQAFLHDTLLKLWQDLEKRTKLLFILLDDLDNFMAVPEIVMTLRQTLSMEAIKNSKIVVGLASTPETWFGLTAVSQHHPLSRYFMSRVELGPLSHTDLQATLVKSLAGTGVTFSPEIRDLVFEYTEGHPYEMQVLCYHLFHNQISRKVDPSVWPKALAAALGDLGIAVFDRMYNQASGQEAKVLLTIAKADSALSVKEIQSVAISDRLGIPEGNVSKYLQRLVEKKLACKSGRGLYMIADKMFRAYLRTRATE